MFRRVPAVVSTIKRKKMTELTKDTKHNRQDELTRPLVCTGANLPIVTYVFLVAFLFSVFQGS